MLVGYAVVASIGYGLAMNFSFWPFQLGLGTALSFEPGAAVGENLHSFLLYAITTSLVWEIGRAITTALGVVLVGIPVLATLRRGAARVAFLPADSRPAGSVREAPGSGGPDPSSSERARTFEPGKTEGPRTFDSGPSERPRRPDTPDTPP